MLGSQVDWLVTDHLLARIAHILAGANWQRGGGKGRKPRPLKVPTGKPRLPRSERRADGMRRMRNLGLLPGHAPPTRRRLTAQEARLAEQIRLARERQAQQPKDG